MLKTILVTAIYLTGAFSSGFNSQGMPIASNSYWQQRVGEASGRNMVIAKTIKRKDFAPALNNLEDWKFRKFTRVKAWILRQKTTGIRLVYLPPLVDSKGIRYLAGIAELCRPKDGVALVWANDTNQAGENRVFTTQLIAAHEIGHAVGAWHDSTMYLNGASIMHPYAAAPEFIRPDMEFSNRSKSEIRFCLTSQGM